MGFGFHFEAYPILSCHHFATIQVTTLSKFDFLFPPRPLLSRKLATIRKLTKTAATFQSSRYDGRQQLVASA
eukprot:g56485.t1